jgi:hypothetical protein
MSEAGTYLTIFFAITCWSVALVSAAGTARIAWTAGLGLYLAHILFAFDAFYDWSHHLAIEVTAKETAAVIGLETGSGLWVNYAFGLILALDVLRQWRSGTRRYAVAIDWLVIFMIVNGAIIFADGITRLYGAVLFIAVIALRWRRRGLTARENS